VDRLKLYARLRQRTFRPEFQIDVPSDRPLSWALAEWIDTAPYAAPESTAALRSANTDRPAPDDGNDSKRDRTFLLSLANEYFKLSRSMHKLAAEDKGARSVSRAVDAIHRLLNEHGIEVRDLTGQVYDFGRRDFESLAPPEPVSGLSRMEIVLCERPAVMVDGELAQTAKGIVGKPA
jgi:hypothetical protein